MKKILLGCMAILVTMALWSFTQPKDKHTWKPSETAIWYYWDGDGDKHEQESYSPVPESLDCDGTSVFCGILAEPDGMDPDVPSEAGITAAASSSSNFSGESALVEFVTH